MKEIDWFRLLHMQNLEAVKLLPYCYSSQRPLTADFAYTYD